MSHGRGFSFPSMCSGGLRSSLCDCSPLRDRSCLTNMVLAVQRELEETAFDAVVGGISLLVEIAL